MEMYVHVPFCRSKCLYCDFASWAGAESLMPDYVDAVLKEADARAAELGQQVMETAFLGGGTPSVLPSEQLARLLRGITARFPLETGAEFTTEANPGTLTEQWLQTAVDCGVNRLSMGMQAFQDTLLKTIGRAHRFEQVEQSVRLARRCGIDNISLDLMFGLPRQTLAMWRETLEEALSLQPQHLSCYGLIPEAGTPLYALLEEGALKLPEEDEERAMYDECIAVLKKHGFEQYEISNFALPEYRCKHNMGYWKQTRYLGLGASAASMLDTSAQGALYSRQTNPRSIDAYIHMVNAQTWEKRENELISPFDARFETMMLALRTTQGVSEDEFFRMHGVALRDCYGEKLCSLKQRGLLAYRDGRWALTRRGMDIQNSILVELMDD